MLNIFKGIHTGPLESLTTEEVELAKNLHRHVETLSVTIGNRNLLQNPKNLDAASEYIEAELRALGFAPSCQTYRVSGAILRNIDADLPGRSSPEEIIVIGAHYDSIAIPGGCPGANDNATGVAATLELARMLRARHHARTIRFVGFVNEEPPYFQTDDMGSFVYAKRCRERNENIIAMITPETIGCYSDSPGTQHFPMPLNCL